MNKNKRLIVFFSVYLLIVILVLFRVFSFWPFVPYDMFSHGFIKDNKVSLVRAGYYDENQNLVFFKYVNSTRWMRQKYRDAMMRSNMPLVHIFFLNDCKEQEVKLDCNKLRYFVAVRTANIENNADVSVVNTVNYSWSPAVNE